MREILFRGKRLDNGEWVFGDLYHRGKEVVITSFYTKHHVAVEPETVGQFTGQEDKGGERIFEGDVVTFTRINALGYTTRRRGDVRYYDKLPIFYIMANTGDAWDWCDCDEIEVIGNIHDDTELLRGG